MNLRGLDSSTLTMRLLAGIGTIVLWLPFTGHSQTQGSTIFQESFQNAPPRYSYALMFPPESNYTFEHMPSGGADGSGAGHIRMRPGREQYNLGWVASGGSFAVGEAVFIRFRIRWDDDHTWLGDGSLQNKFILLGLNSASPPSRLIIHNEKPHSTAYCTLGYNNSQWMPRDYGLNYSSWTDPAIAGKYGSLSVKLNLGPTCTPPIIVTRGVWYNVQVYARSSINNDGEFKIWVNNDNLNAPNAQVRGFNLGTTGWGEMTVGGFMSAAPTSEGGYRIDDVQMADYFDPNWNGSIGPRPEPPQGVRAD